MTIAPFTRQSRPDRSVLRLAGEGVLAFLNNLLTAVEKVAEVDGFVNDPSPSGYERLVTEARREGAGSRPGQ